MRQRARPRQYGRPERAQLRGNEVVRMHVMEGMSFQEIGTVLGVSRSRAWQLYRGALNRAARYQDGEEHVSMQRTLAILQLAISEAHEVVTRTCPKCHSHGTRNGKQCMRCHGTGFWYAQDERRRWLDRMMKANEQRSRLLGEGDPKAWDSGGDGEDYSVREIVLRMDPDDVARQARVYLQGREDERAQQGANLTAAVNDKEGGAGV